MTDLEQLQGAVLALPEGWKPIETAPKDDDIDFLGWDGERMDVTSLGWFDEHGKPVYWHADCVSWKPTHWMPLPQPPKEPT